MWRLERAGILNFWYYDEAEFELVDGRLVLRGANGSGKSVTMQSFLPLVLDGDKRPWRLDPFGSRDRRIEYYLLLEPDSGITERTAYLWLEFYHQEQERYLTVGIGLRARRNQNGVNFWGFAITDNRRPGRNIFFYKRDFSSGREEHIPLTRAELEEAIGAGGEVVREQGEYQQLVNRLLFGYSEPQAYQELLDLLIQLRSPKLSKDFKPSTVYEILQAALPPLLDDELRPLAEVLEEMDAIGDRLAELEIHTREVEGLQRSYHNYNALRLYTASRELLAARRHQQEQQHMVQAEAETITGLEETLVAIAGELQAREAEQQQIQAEVKVLSEHEAWQKQSELNRLRQEAGRLEADCQRAATRSREWRERADRATREKEALAAELETNRASQYQILTEMGPRADEAAFSYHPIYAGSWEKAPPLTEPSWQSWLADLRQQEEHLGRALELARRLTQLGERRRLAEVELSRAREERDGCEAAEHRAEAACAAAQEALQESIFAWRRQLQVLPLTENTLQAVLAALTRYPEVDYEDCRAPVQDSYHQAREALMARRVEWQRQLQEHQAQKEALVAELKEWQTRKEPQPPAGEARQRARQRRGNGSGAPLYAACEFRPEVEPALQARLEATLEAAGLLDAWLSPGGLIGVAEDEEEVWLEAAPLALGPTLADFLYPTPPTGSGLTEDQVAAVLATIAVDTDYAAGGAVLPETGRFQLGPLAGQVPGKPRAEYIGLETRRQTRLAAIARLEGLIQEEEEVLARCREELRRLEEEETTLRQELAAFPGGEELRHAWQQWEKAHLALEQAAAVVASCSTRLGEIAREQQQVTADLHQLLAGSPLPPREAGLEAAMAALRHYRELVLELKAAWQQGQSLLARAERATSDLEEARARLAREEQEEASLRARLAEYQAQVAAVEKILADMGLADIDRRLKELTAHLEELNRTLKSLTEKHQQHDKDLAVARTRLEGLTSELDRRREATRAARQNWDDEWQRRLLAEWEEVADPASDAELEQVLQQIVRRYRERWDKANLQAVTNSLMDAFHSARQALLDYVPELLSDEESERLLVVFCRDRDHPLTPALLLKELEQARAEQQLLLSQKDRELYEEILFHDVGKTISQKINRAERWVREMNRLMQARQTSSGLRLSLKWEPRPAQNEREMDTAELIKLLRFDRHLLRDEQIDRVIEHFRSRINWARQEAESQDTLRQRIKQVLDYREWFRFTLYYEKGDQPRRELTDSRFNVLSGGEKAMAMYIPLFAATYSRYSDARADAPRLISLDEAFAGVDEENLQDMFGLLTEMGFNYMMTSQVLWGCYASVPGLAIYELYRPRGATCVTIFHYRWDGYQRHLVEKGNGEDAGADLQEALAEVAAGEDSDSTGTAAGAKAVVFGSVPGSDFN
ncbi:TIGR02680 family protein [Moorella sp. Hama-1]|uniref:TIGR02680 family protein n=1 Tax=Moorella sp. Hama-1 TaxID=2138101 RepID=UPI000D6594FE|nr:TIGR02680 family protein [Moorella sp. Hama-1]BCV20598.1 TIGR02680 family protein [Moorella sp. Hama-1]